MPIQLCTYDLGRGVNYFGFSVIPINRHRCSSPSLLDHQSYKQPRFVMIRLTPSQLRRVPSHGISPITSSVNSWGLWLRTPITADPCQRSSTKVESRSERPFVNDPFISPPQPAQSADVHQMSGGRGGTVPCFRQMAVGNRKLGYSKAARA